MSNTNYQVVQYSDALQLADENEYFSEAFNTMVENFSNNGLNVDVENFLKRKAKSFDSIGMAKTYLVVDNGLEDICGYFAIAPKSITIKQIDWEKITKSTRQKLNPFGYKDIKNDQNIPSILLGQIGKNFSSTKQISGDDLLNVAFTTIHDVAKQIGGRYLYLEADDNEKLANYYTKNGFSFLSYAGGDVYKNKNNQVMFIKKMSD